MSGDTLNKQSKGIMSDKIDISEIRAGDEVQLAHGDWYEIEERGDGDNMDLCARPLGLGLKFLASFNLITAHRPAQPEQPQFEWLTEDEFSELHAKWHMEPKTDFFNMVNAKLTAKYPHGPLTVKTATGEEEGDGIVIVWLAVGASFQRKHSLQKGDPYIDLPDLSKEGES